MERKLTDIVNNEALEYAMYTIENRSVANGIDGLKPVQRFVLYSVLNNASKSFDKVAALGSSVSKIGYNHGETNAQDALALMAANWKNNISIIKGRGCFGSRMVQESASARYVYAMLHEDFHNYFKDIELSPEHKDVEHVPPQFYVPVLPMILMNGVFGVGTGFACKILPHDPEWVKKAVVEHLSGKEISEPVIKYPEFEGTIEKISHNKYAQKGNIEISGLTVVVTEIPTVYDYEKYIAELDKLVETGKISSYVDETSDKFQFKVRCKRGTDMTESKIIDLLKLKSVATQNINVIDENYKIRHFDDVRELVKWFVDYRLTFLPTRIKHALETSTERSKLSIAKSAFIKDVVSGKVVLFGKKRAEASKELKADPKYSDYVSELLSMSVDKMTDDEIAKLDRDVEAAKKEIAYWTNTTAKKEFIKDLKGI